MVKKQLIIFVNRVLLGHIIAKKCASFDDKLLALLLSL
jgi:hypothetical protein